MRVGLVRHFRVSRGFPTARVTPEELLQWFEEYDASEVEPCTVDLGGIVWERCYSSDIPRAARTAEAIFQGEIVFHERLRETPLPFFRLRMRQPILVWGLLARLALATSSAALRESKRDLEQRAACVLDEILSCGGSNVLIVSHGGLMIFMRRELLRRGFRGPRFGTPANGTLYLYEKP